MSPAKLIEKEKRRFSDDPEYTAFRWSIGAVKIIAYFLLDISPLPELIL